MPKSVCSNFLINLVNFRSGFYELIFFHLMDFTGYVPVFYSQTVKKKKMSISDLRLYMIFDMMRSKFLHGHIGRWEHAHACKWIYMDASTCGGLRVALDRSAAGMHTSCTS